MNTNYFDFHELTLGSEAKYLVKLYQVPPGETFSQILSSIKNEGMGVATIEVVNVWLNFFPEIRLHNSIVIADPTQNPKIFCKESDWPIVLIPAVACSKGKIYHDGMIDLYVPARSVEESGVLAILAIKSV